MEFTAFDNAAWLIENKRCCTEDFSGYTHAEKYRATRSTRRKNTFKKALAKRKISLRRNACELYENSIHKYDTCRLFFIQSCTKVNRKKQIRHHHLTTGACENWKPHDIRQLDRMGQMESEYTGKDINDSTCLKETA